MKRQIVINTDFYGMMCGILKSISGAHQALWGLQSKLTQTIGEGKTKYLQGIASSEISPAQKRKDITHNNRKQIYPLFVEMTKMTDVYLFTNIIPD